MIAWFRRTRPTPPPERVDTGELLAAYYWGYTPNAWSRLTNTRRAWCRENIVHAPKFEPRKR